MGTQHETEEGFEPTLTESIRESLDPLIYLISQVALVLALAYGVFLRQDL